MMLGELSRHFYMTRGVARVLGFNLSDGLRVGILTPERYGEMVTRCQTCQHADRCEAWLATTVSDNDPPPNCCIADDFRMLAESLR